MKFDTKLINGKEPIYKYYNKFYITRAGIMETDFEVETIEGIMYGKKGDYLCKGPVDELYPCNKEVFEMSYKELS